MVAPIGFVDENAIGSRRGYALGERERFGTGVDGAYAQTGGSVSFTGDKHFASVSIASSAIYGPTTKRGGCLYVQGTLSVILTSSLQATWDPGTAGGASRATVGGGNPGAGTGYTFNTRGSNQFVSGFGGSGGAGGGGAAAQNGGAGGLAWHSEVWPIHVSQQRAGAVGNGSPGYTSVAPDIFGDLNYFNCPAFCVGMNGTGGGGGAVENVGTGAAPASGVGGVGAQGGGPLHIQARNIVVDGGSFVTVSGSTGSAGGNAVDSGGADSVTGGGGGGGGGGAGMIRCLCETVTGTARFRATGASGGAGGAGVGGAGNGGTGGKGSDGIIALSATISQAA